jgi:hypothetical protein
MDSNGQNFPRLCLLAINLETLDHLGFREARTIVRGMRTNANVEVDAGTKTFASGLLPDLIAALRRSRKGDLVAVRTARQPSRKGDVDPRLEGNRAGPR